MTGAARNPAIAALFTTVASDATEAALTHAAALRRKQAQEIANAVPGHVIRGVGVYLGQWQPRDRKFRRVGPLFNVLAAPEDLPRTREYIPTVKYIAKLKNWHGCDGANIETMEDFLTLIRTKRYDGGWMVPPRDVMEGKDLFGRDTMADNLLRHKDKPGFGKFNLAISDGESMRTPDWYWTCTGGGTGMTTVCLATGESGFSDEYEIFHSCRPVRMLPAPKGGPRA
jgi:hypothetical protein